MIKKGVLVVGALVVLIVFYSLGRQFYESLEVNKRLDRETEELVFLQKKNSELKKRLEEVQSISFIEQQARDKLNLARSGETIVIIPQKEIDKVLGLDKKIEEIKLSNWQAWLKLFFK